MVDLKNILGEQLYKRYENIDLESLKRENEIHNFVEVHPLIEKIINAMKSLEIYPQYWNFIHQNDVTNISNNLKNFMSFVERIIIFDPTQGNPNLDKKGIEDNIRIVYRELNNLFITDLEIFLLKKQTSLSETAKISKKVLEDINKIKRNAKESENIIKSMQTAAKTKGVGKFADIFMDQAKKNKKSAYAWLAVSVVSILSVGLFVSILFNGVSTTDMLETGNLHSLLSRVIVLSLLTYLVYNLFRNYNVNMHQHTLNKHRENSLRTFETFVESTENEKMKDAILLQATKTIFEAGDTGYILNKGNKSLIEMITNRNSE